MPKDVTCNVAGGTAAVDKRSKLSSTTSYQRGVTAFMLSSYNQSVMSTVRDAAQESQFASSFLAAGRVLAALPGVPAALSGESAVAIAPQPVR